MKDFPQKIKVRIHTSIGLFGINKTDDNRIIITGGFESELSKVYSESLGSEFEFVLPTDEITWGRKLPNNSWTGILGLAHRKEVNIIMGGIFMREERQEVGFPTATYKMEEIRSLTRLLNIMSKTFVFAAPFHVDVSISILVSAAIIAVVFFWLHGKKFPIFDHFFSLFALLMLQSAEIQPGGSLRQRIPFACWILVAQLLSLSYMSVLLSLMTVPKREAIIDNFEKLLHAVDEGRFKIATPKDMPLYLQWLETNENPTKRRLGKYVRDNDWYVRFAGPITINALANNFAVIFPLFGKTLWMRSGVTVSDEIFYSGGLVLYSTKNFCCREALELVITRTAAGGIYKKILDHYVFKRQMNNEKNILEQTTEDIKTLTIEDLNGSILLFSGGMISSILVLILEMRLKRKTMEEKQGNTNVFSKFFAKENIFRLKFSDIKSTATENLSVTVEANNETEPKTETPGFLEDTADAMN